MNKNFMNDLKKYNYKYQNVDLLLNDELNLIFCRINM